MFLVSKQVKLNKNKERRSMGVINKIRKILGLGKSDKEKREEKKEKEEEEVKERLKNLGYLE